MFGDKRGKAVDAIVDGLKPVIRFSAMHGGLPTGYWQDPYVLGLEDYPDEPVILRARKAGSDYTTVFGHTDRKNPERTRTAGALVHILFHNIVSERLGH